MKMILQRLAVLTFLSSMGLLFSLMLITKSFVIYKIDMHIIFVLSLLVSNLLVVTLIYEYGVYSTAKLIVDNKIMHIEAAEIQQKSNDAASKTFGVEDLEVFISCFGILLGSRVIKFNIDGINLKKIEIGNDFIHIIYSSNNRIQIIKLIHSVIGKEELQSIAERFRYETGITPTIID
jgi:hypothetical protein